MKKLNLRQIDLVGAEVLTREQLKKVLGGGMMGISSESYGTHSVPVCKDECTSNSDCSDGHVCKELTFGDGAKCNRCILPENAE